MMKKVFEVVRGKNPGRRVTDMTNPWKWIVIALVAGILISHFTHMAMADDLFDCVPVDKDTPLADTHYSPKVRYFPFEAVQKHHALLMSENDVLPLDRLNSVIQHGILDDGRIIGSVVFSTKDMIQVNKDTGQTSFNDEVREYYRIAEVWRTPGEVKAAYPEMQGFTEVTDPETQEVTQIPRFKMTKWFTQYCDVGE